MVTMWSQFDRRETRYHDGEERHLDLDLDDDTLAQHLARLPSSAPDPLDMIEGTPERHLFACRVAAPT